MVKFSVGIEEDGEGPSNRVPKRQRFNRMLDVEGDRDGEESEEDLEEEGEEEEEEEEEESGAEEGTMIPQTTTDGSVSISFTLTDPEVLDCSICYEPLAIPVFQCENGHIACSTCCVKIRNKCPSCAAPIGYNRCKALEKVLESVKVSCENAKYGCRETISYSMKQRHDKSCPFAECSCPIIHCDFIGSSKQLYGHFGNVHKSSTTSFQYDRSVHITLRVYQSCLFLREETDGSLFMLNNKVETLGNLISLSRVGPSEERGYFYDLTAKAQPEGSTLRLQSFTKSNPIRHDSDWPPSLGFLLVPSQFSCNSRLLKMDLRIWHHHDGRQFPYIIERPSGT